MESPSYGASKLEERRDRGLTRPRAHQSSRSQNHSKEQSWSSLLAFDTLGSFTHAELTLTYQALSDSAQALIARIEGQRREKGDIEALLAQEAMTARMPSFLAINGSLLSYALSLDQEDTSSPLRAEALRRMLRLAWIGGVKQAMADAISEIERCDVPPWLSLLAEALKAKSTKSYDAAIKAWKRAADAIDEKREPQARVDLLMARIDLEFSAGHAKGAKHAAEHLGACLEETGDPYPGERYHAYNALGIACINLNQSEEAIGAAEQALTIAREVEASKDIIMATIALIPPLLHHKRSDKALKAIHLALKRAMEASEVHAEMALRNLELRALEQDKRVADGIKAGFIAIERAGLVGTVDHHLGFAAHVATLYFKAGAHLDAYNVLDQTREGLSRRADASEALERVEGLIKAMAKDLGAEAFEAIVEACEARRGSA